MRRVRASPPNYEANILRTRSVDYHVRLEPMHANIVAEVRPTILALLGAVIFLLLIACTNVANLLMVRSSLRERELSVRTALGASRWRLMRQMLAESVVIAGCGTAIGLGLARLGIHQLIVMGPENLPRLGSVAIDPVVVAFSGIAGLAAAAIFGLVPALRASRPDVMQVLRGSGRTASLGGGHRLRNAAVVTEVALSFVLLIGSGLMFRSSVALQHIDPGYDPHGTCLTFPSRRGNRGGNACRRSARRFTARYANQPRGPLPAF